MIPATNGVHVLIVDDYDDNRCLFADYLRWCGFRVSEAATGEEALQQARDSPPDVVLMDLSLPGIDGHEATRQLRAAPATRDVLIIAVSGHALPSWQASASAAGCDRFVTKPCPPRALVEVVRAELARRGAPTAAADADRLPACDPPCDGARHGAHRPPHPDARPAVDRPLGGPVGGALGL